MTTAALLFMALIGLIAVAIAATLIVTAPRRRSEAQRYVSRLSGVMFAAVGLCLIVYTFAWRSVG